MRCSVEAVTHLFDNGLALFRSVQTTIYEIERIHRVNSVKLGRDRENETTVEVKSVPWHPSGEVTQCKI